MSSSPAAAPKPARLAGEVAGPLALTPAAMGLLTPTHTPRQYFDALVAADLAEDGIRFLAAALPKREAVWWAVQCFREACPRPGEPATVRAIAAAGAWARDPSEANRREAGAAADAAGHGTAAGCAAAAAFWSGGSLAPPHLQPVPPADDLTGKAVAGSLLLASILSPLGHVPALKRFLAVGSEIASGRMKIH
jgi:hypothetical protein